MCFSDDDYSYESRFEVRNGQRYYAEDYHPRFGMSRRRKYGLGGSYYPSRYYVGPPRGRHISNAVIRPNSYSQSGGGYPWVSCLGDIHAAFQAGTLKPWSLEVLLEVATLATRLGMQMVLDITSGPAMFWRSIQR
ncbi:hypothetical protein CUC08_Gglean001095 [Alternaria sp. MG1]|jgi:hypothetical protein|nr:hypothetical protein CUC08_Gglean001095 [Alternaria sp. MG1]